MNRKHFLQSFFTAGLSAFLAGKTLATGKEKVSFRSYPPFLQPGDTVGITCPAGHVDASKLSPCLNTIERWGLNVQLGKTVGTHWQRFGGTDEERLKDFQAMLDDENINAIIFGKGGYGAMRIIDQVNWDKFIEKPKWLVGYSDLTIVHLHIHANTNIPTIHGDMSNGFSADPFDPSSLTLQKALFGEKLEYTIKGDPFNIPGVATGKLIGGNLSLLHSAAGSKSDISTKGKILFIEEVSEYKYNIDRMMMSLKRSGKLDHLAGLIAGGFTATKYDSEEAFNLTLEEIILDKVAEYDYPVCFHFPAGHVKTNNALKMGVNYELNVGKYEVQLIEMRPLVSSDVVSTADYLSTKKKPATNPIRKNSTTALLGQ